MKRCPECRRDYYDDTLLYCLDDGSKLVDGPAASESRTLVLSGGDSAGSGSQFQSRLPKLSQITFSESIEQYPAWSPTGEDLAFSREDAGIRSIFVKNIESGEERRLT